MADPQYLSTDPTAGEPIATAPHPEARIGSPKDSEPVTLGDLQADPVSAMIRIGSILKRDAMDPKTWLTLAASYFGPKLITAAAPVVGNAAAAASRGLKGLATVGMVKDLATVGLGESRVGGVMRIAGRVADAVGAARATPPDAVPTPAVTTASGGPAPVLAKGPAVSGAATVEPSAPPPTSILSDAAVAERLAQPRISPARIANDLGIAARRAGVQLTAADDAAVLSAIAKGADPSQAIADVIAAKAPKMPVEDAAAELQRRWGTPSDADRTFPPNKSGLPTKAPQADLKAKIDVARAKVRTAAKAPDLTPEIDYALKWIENDMEAIPYTKRTVIEHPDQGMGGAQLGGGGSAGAKVYRNIVGADGRETSSATRADVLQAIKNIRAGKITKTGQKVLDVAQEISQMSEAQLKKLMETPPQ